PQTLSPANGKRYGYAIRNTLIIIKVCIFRAVCQS
ncbi:unnamed protein product, partial [marine sediment metagenome]